MVHQTTFSKDFLPQNYSQFDVQKALNELVSIELKTAQIILAETTARALTPLTIDQVRAAIFQTTIVGAPQALSYGIVDTHGLTPVALAKEVFIYIEDCMPSNSL